MGKVTLENWFETKPPKYKWRLENGEVVCYSGGLFGLGEPVGQAGFPLSELDSYLNFAREKLDNPDELLRFDVFNVYARLLGRSRAWVMESASFPESQGMFTWSAAIATVKEVYRGLIRLYGEVATTLACWWVLSGDFPLPDLYFRGELTEKHREGLNNTWGKLRSANFDDLRDKFIAAADIINVTLKGAGYNVNGKKRGSKPRSAKRGRK